VQIYFNGKKYTDELKSKTFTLDPEYAKYSKINKSKRKIKILIQK